MYFISEEHARSLEIDLKLKTFPKGKYVVNSTSNTKKICVDDEVSSSLFSKSALVAKHTHKKRTSAFVQF